MEYQPSATRDVFARACSFPADHAAVIDAAGDVAIACPNGETVTVETVLDRTDEDRYETLDALHSTLMANLSDDHVGRKHYDDRSSNPQHDDELSF